ncbi:hypothetical protein WA158_005301 [Blastocystis sp. Blastoise]
MSTTIEEKVNGSNVKHFFVFNRTLSVYEEGAESDEMAEKILFFYPQETSLYDKVNCCNICEGLLDFTENDGKVGIQYVSTDSSLFCFYQCEPKTWMVLELEYEKENGVVDINTVCYEGLKSVLEDIYNSYLFIHGPIEPVITEKTSDGVYIMGEILSLRSKVRKYLYYYEGIRDGDITENEENKRKAELYEPLKEKLNNYLCLSPADNIRNRLRELIETQFKYIKWDNISVFNMMQGFCYLPLSSSQYLDINSILLRLLYVFKEIKYTTFLYDNFIIWSNIMNNQLSCVYYHHLHEPSDPKTIGFHTFKANDSTHLYVYIKEKEEIKKYVFMKYIYQNITILLLVSLESLNIDTTEDYNNNSYYFRYLNNSFICVIWSLFNPQRVTTFQNNVSMYLADVWTTIDKQLKICRDTLIQNPLLDRTFSYIYIDRSIHKLKVHNLTQSVTQYMPQTLYQLSSSVPPEYNKFMNTLYIRMQHDTDNYIRIPTGEWICGKRIGGCVIIFVLNKRIATTLGEAHISIKNILTTCFPNISSGTI